MIQVELGVSCQLDKQGGEPDDRGLMILPLTVSDHHYFQISLW